MSSTLEPVQTSKSPGDLQEKERGQITFEQSRNAKNLDASGQVGQDAFDVKAPVEKGSLEVFQGSTVNQNGVLKVQTMEDLGEVQHSGAGEATGIEHVQNSVGAKEDGQASPERGSASRDADSEAKQVIEKFKNIMLNDANFGMPTSSAVKTSTQQDAEEKKNDDHVRKVEDRIRGSMSVDTNIPVENVFKAEKESSVPETDQSAKSEIQSIMDQFDEGSGPGESEIMSPRLEIAQPQMFPPRSSSLEPSKRDSISAETSSATGFLPLYKQPTGQSVSGRSSGTFSDHQGRISDVRAMSPDVTSSPRSSMSAFKPVPPEPDPEPDLPFDFHRFLEQLRHRTADPVAKFLRSFLLEFGKKQWMVHEQVKIISDFLEFISKKMAQCEVWRTVSDAEFDNAREGMEKLVMNRLYTQTFSPAILPPEPTAGKGRRKNTQTQNGPGRRGQHQEDVERDDVLAQKVRIYGWVREEHLDIKPVGEKGRKFLKLAQQGKQDL